MSKKVLSVRRIAVLGAESTGKTWLCEQLARHYNTVWVPEYAREYFAVSDINNYSPDDLVRIAERQLSLEEEFMPLANRYLFCDTTLITLKIWAELEFAHCPDPILEGLGSARYDFFLLTENDVVWQPDPLRQNRHSRDKILTLNMEEVERTGKPFSVVKGEGMERLRNAVQAIEEMQSST